MTREEAIEEINKVFEPAFANYIITALTEGATASDKALEQEPCEDAISRRAVLACKQTFHDNVGYETEYVDIEDIKALPSIQPKADVLDKIRAEIEEQKGCRCFDDDDMLVYRTGLDDALCIIDKYKAESEDRE